MRSIRAVVAVLLLLAGCVVPRVALDDAQQDLEHRRFRAALSRFDRVARSRRATDAERARALTGAALACERLGDLDGARARLEQAISPEVPGASEVALFELAELEHVRDRARSLSLYYRAAAGAQKNLGGRFPYHEASNRIIELSNSR